MTREATLTYSAAKAKAENYCAFQERSQQEVRQKLYAWGLGYMEVENLLAELINEGFLNEERFAVAYAGGRHRMKKWGKFKIKQGLKQKAVSDPLIRIALESLDPDEYRENLLDLLAKKARTLSEKDPFKRKIKLQNYALGKGYEQSLTIELLNDNELH
ncbi:MAG TPA: regulatory protein RecX [Sphingobacteriaceae bacterium]|nr:regulatory protein RecX [Sphingobacteriaceae bacterium]